MSLLSRSCAVLGLLGTLLAPGIAAGQSSTLRSPSGVQGFFLPYANFIVPFQIFGSREQVTVTNPTGAYIILVWNDPAVESDSVTWSGYRVRRTIPGITAETLTTGAPTGEVVGQLKARDLLTSICLSDRSYCNTNYNVLGIGGGFFFRGFQSNRRSDGTYLIDYKVLWRDVALPVTRDIRALWGASSLQASAVGAGGTILGYDGFQWSQVASPVQSNLNGVFGSSGTNVFAVGDSCRILRFNGTVWDTMPRPLGWARVIGDTLTYVPQALLTNLRAVGASSATDAYAVGDSCRILRFNGTAWDTLARPTVDIGTGTPQARITPLRAVWAGSPASAIAVGDSGLVLQYDGSTWAPSFVADSTNLYGLWGASGSDIFAVGDRGLILHFDGAAWTPMASGTSRRLRAVWGNSSSDVFAAGDAGEILHYDGNGGGTWSEMTSTSPASMRGVWGASGTNLFAAGLGASMVHYDGTAQDVDDCMRCKVFLDTGNLSGFRSRYAVTSIDTTSAQYDKYPESDITEVVTITASTPPADNLEHVAVVPNPYHGSAEWDVPGQRQIHFIHIPDGATIRIFTSNLELVRVLKLNAHATNEGVTGEVVWDMRNGSGREVKTGIYIYQVETLQGRTRVGHFVIIK
jgi:hypothetical protein